MTTRLKQILLVSVGIVGAAIMVMLGLWQMQVFVDQGNRGVADRAAQPPVPLTDHLGDAGAVGDIYGKQVTIVGRYLDGQQELIPTEGGWRVLAAFEIADGRILPVVRGLASAPSPLPALPAGERTEVGLFLPGEGDPEPGTVGASAAPGELGSVRMPLLAQRWPQQLVPGFVTLSEPDAAQHGLAKAPVALPAGEGAARNSGYALQWWVFAAFGLGMAIKLAHGLGVRERRAQEAAALASLHTDTTQGAGPASADRKESMS
ncbi:MAG: SURF1 family protein [Propioniciclava sp.]|uniref:SURF1 family protein n=1 Tax=Propioniciclava sp. TaxID=2038686 RepID=UPI0039E33607